MAGTAASPALGPSTLNALVSIGSAQMFVIGLNPQRIGTMSEGRVVGLPTFGGMDWQPTGLGEAHTRFEALTYPHVIGGLDAVALLQQHHEAQDVVNFIRLSNMTTYLGRMMGRVVIRHLFIDETHLHPFDGVGRRVGVEIDLVSVGGVAFTDFATPTSGAQ